jgi:hypothetical protein
MLRARRAATRMAAVAALAALSAPIVLQTSPAQALPRESDCSTARLKAATDWAIYRTYLALVQFDLQAGINTTSDANSAYAAYQVWTGAAAEIMDC